MQRLLALQPCTFSPSLLALALERVTKRAAALLAALPSCPGLADAEVGYSATDLAGLLTAGFAAGQCARRHLRHDEVADDLKVGLLLGNGVRSLWNHMQRAG